MQLRQQRGWYNTSLLLMMMLPPPLPLPSPCI
jgi:hypothetical protein